MPPVQRSVAGIPTATFSRKSNHALAKVRPAKMTKIVVDTDKLRRFRELSK
jgi:hypothetical protein